MKIRTDFVTNSSSASFIVELSFCLKDGRILEHKDWCEFPTEEGSLSGLSIETQPRQLGSASSIEEMLTLLKKHIWIVEMAGEYESFGDFYIFDEDDEYAKELLERKVKPWDDYLEGNKEYLRRNYELIEQLRNLKDMSEIEKIILKAEASEYDYHEEEYIEYDLQTKTYIRKAYEYEGISCSAGGITMSDDPGVLNMLEEEKTYHLKVKFTNPEICSLIEKYRCKENSPSYSKIGDVISIETDTVWLKFETEKQALTMILRVLKECGVVKDNPYSRRATFFSAFITDIEKIRWATNYLEIEATMCIDEEKGLYKKMTSQKNKKNRVYTYREELYNVV